MWRLDEREPQGCTNRPDRWDLAQQLRGVVLSALGQQLSPRLLVQEQQCIELLVVKLRPVAHAGLGDFHQPFGTMTRCIDLLTGTGNRPASVESFQTNHY